MNRQLPRLFLSLLLLLLTAGVVFLLGCGEESTTEPEPGATSGTAESAVQEVEGAVVYHVRGEVLELPDPDDPLSGLYIRHEAIDNFRNMDGEIAGMDSMTMAFPVPDDLEFDEVEVGDKVTFELTVDYDGDPIFQVTAMEPLPEDSELSYGKAQPDGEAGGSGSP